MFDYDFHPDEPSIRRFSIPEAGILRNEEDGCTYQTVDEDGIVLRHFAFAEEWFKLNATFDRAGTLIETGLTDPIAVNCDIATPMQRLGDDLAAVDLFLDVMINADCRTYRVIDQDEFEDACRDGLLSPAEERGALAGLDRLINWIESGRLEQLMKSYDPAIAAQAPPPGPFQGVPLDSMPELGREQRPTWRG